MSLIDVENLNKNFIHNSSNNPESKSSIKIRKLENHDSQVSGNISINHIFINLYRFRLILKNTLPDSTISIPSSHTPTITLITKLKTENWKTRCHHNYLLNHKDDHTRMLMTTIHHHLWKLFKRYTCLLYTSDAADE